jgi:membrane protein YqaA with SNARE-associated domain
MLHRLYNWTMGLAGHRHALLCLAAVTCAESVFFPIPPDVLIIPMVLAARNHAWRIAGVATLTSVAGGLMGYGIGYFLFEELGKPIIEFYGYMEKYHVFQGWYREYGAWIVAAGGFTPIPYKVVAIATGVVQLDVITFIVVSTLSRGARFYLTAALLWRFGEPIRDFIEARLALMATLFFVMLFLGFILLGYLL